MRIGAIPGRRRILAGLAAGLAGCALNPGRSAAAAPRSSGCTPMAHEGADYSVCRYDLRAYAIRLFFLDPDGQPYGSVTNLARSPAGARLVMATNAGMYHPDLRPVGLYVENGRELTRLNAAAGPGNFHLKPNGVFFVGPDGRAGILETGAFSRRRPPVRLATQSGPMLVIDGELHPRFADEGPSHKIRNGVGVVDPSTVVFAISDEPVSFGAFARLFRDALGCPNALFLDGSISTLYAPELGRVGVSLKPLGPLLGVEPR